MAKSADAFRTISEVAEWLDTPAHVLRFWESKFTQVKPVKRAGGRRYYRPQDMRLLGGIKKLLHDDGMTIKGVQKLLRENGIKHVSSLSQPLAGEEDTALPHVPAPETQEPAQVLDFRPRSEDTAAEPPSTFRPEAANAPDETEHEPAGEPPVPPQRDFTLTHSVPQNPAATEKPADDARAPAPETPGESTGEPNLFADDDTAPEEDRNGVEDDETHPWPGAEDTAESDPKLPGFLTRDPAAEDTASEDAPATEDTATGEQEDPAPSPAPVPLNVDVPDDPADDAFVTPGPLTMLAEVPRPFTAPMIRSIRPIVQRLRKKLDETDET